MSEDQPRQAPDSDSLLEAKYLGKCAIIAAIIGALAMVAVAFFEYSGGAVPTPPLTGEANRVNLLEQRLNAANVLLAGSEDSAAKYRLHLQSSAALNALAENVLATLAGGRLRQPLHLNVINGNYKTLVTGNTDGANLPSIRYEDDEKLREAMILHWNELHPAHEVKEFSEMLD